MAKAGTNKNKIDVKKFAIELDGAFNLSELNAFYRSHLGAGGPTRKYELATQLATFFTCEQLKATFEKLEPLEKLAVSEAVHSEDGFDPEMFEAKYGMCPAFRLDFKNAPSAAWLFMRYEVFRGHRARPSLEACLKSIVPLPQGAQINITRTPLREVFKEDKAAQVEYFARSELAQVELGAMLKAVQDGLIVVSEKTGLPSSDTLAKISRIIKSDYYQWLDAADYKPIGPMRAFAWPMLLTHARLVVQDGKKLKVASSAKNAKSLHDVELLREIWFAFIECAFDELSRISSVKGPRNGRYSMSTSRIRRRAIVETLKQCPQDAWIEFDEFIRFLRASGNTFVVSYQPWNMYSSYGAALGMVGDQLLQELYVRAFLFEYASTLGLIDIAVVPPEFSRRNCESGYFENFSRYDGLLYFRINEVGAFCLSETANSKFTSVDAPKLSVRPSLRIAHVEGNLSIANKLILDAFAEYIADGVWDLSRARAIAACEAGQDIGDLHELLTTLDEQELPDQVETFISQVRSRFTAVESAGAAELFTCRDSAIAQEISSHTLMKDLCSLVGEKQLVVMQNKVEKFRKTLHTIGYGSVETVRNQRR